MIKEYIISAYQVRFAEKKKKYSGTSSFNALYRSILVTKIKGNLG